MTASEKAIQDAIANGGGELVAAPPEMLKRFAVPESSAASEKTATTSAARRAAQDSAEKRAALKAAPGVLGFLGGTAGGILTAPATLAGQPEITAGGAMGGAHAGGQLGRMIQRWGETRMGAAPVPFLEQLSENAGAGNEQMIAEGLGRMLSGGMNRVAGNWSESALRPEKALRRTIAESGQPDVNLGTVANEARVAPGKPYTPAGQKGSDKSMAGILAAGKATRAQIDKAGTPIPRQDALSEYRDLVKSVKGEIYVGDAAKTPHEKLIDYGARFINQTPKHVDPQVAKDIVQMADQKSLRILKAIEKGGSPAELDNMELEARFWRSIAKGFRRNLHSFEGVKPLDQATQRAIWLDEAVRNAELWRPAPAGTRGLFETIAARTGGSPRFQGRVGLALSNPALRDVVGQAPRAALGTADVMGLRDYLRQPPTTDYPTVDPNSRLLEAP